ncbi:potassium channel family protein [Actinomadura sp. 6K520]|uniref:potassium channel family protein n=1 Tax=Actinomadura sp. 6K520 TaxID=2530364 RepID=UPI001045C368|nr:potassium channel family protein [Actinomadura sp. 6K520]TDE36828.1 two pore domain potassium channel family protein [Actinomadura sp. 6K520]
MDAQSRRARRRLVFWTVLRMTLTTVFLIAAYFLAPLLKSFTPLSTTVLAVMLIVLGPLVWWQASSIARSPSPRIRTVEALGTSLTLFVLVFASSYRLMSNDTPPGFSEPLTHIDALFYTVTIFTSVGFGDIVPTSQAARALTTLQMLGDLVFLGVVAKVFLEAMRRGVERRDRERGGGGTGADQGR